MFPPLAEWRRALPSFGLAVVSAFLVRLTYQPYEWAPLAFVALVPLFWGLRGFRPNMAFWIAMAYGLVNGWHFTNWITSVSRFNPLVWLALPPVCVWWALHRAVAVALLVAVVRRGSPWVGFGGGIVLLTAMDYFQMIGAFGLPGGLLGQMTGGWLDLAQLASIGGIPLLTALVVGANLAVFECLLVLRAGYGHAGAAMRLAVVAVPIAVGAWWGAGVRADLNKAIEADDARVLRVALVQTGIAQEVKYESYSSPDADRRRALQDEMFQSLMEQLGALEPGSLDLIVTPESGMTHDFVDIEDHIQRSLYGGVPMRAITDIAREVGAPIIVSATDYVFRNAAGERVDMISLGIDPATGMLRPGYDVYGGLWLIRGTEESVPLTADYRKRRLMPFGETVPYFDVIPGFREKLVRVGNFAAGPAGPPLGILARPSSGEPDYTGAATEALTVRLGPSICFEDLFPYIHRHHVREGVDLFVNATNDGWFDGSTAAEWHLSGARWRCIEMRRPMVRATNTGLTAVIAATGEIGEPLPPSAPAVLTTTLRLPPNAGPTLYARGGDWFGILCLLGAIGIAIRLSRPPKPESHV